MKNITLDISFSLLVWLFSLFLLSSLGFIFNLQITPIYTIISTIFATTILVYRLKDHNISNKMIALILLFLSTILFIFAHIQYHYSDFSFDGNWYHQATIINLKWGWNPIYSTIYDFSKSQIFQFKASYDMQEGYLKCYEILAANLYSVFNKIELVKILKFITALATFSYSIYTIQNNFKISTKLTWIFSVLFIYNPVCIYQFFTNYNDDMVYYLFIILLFSLLNNSKISTNNKTNVIITIISGVLLLCTKLNGTYFTVVALIIWLLFYPSKKLLKAYIVLLTLSILCSINPFATNIKNHNSILFPVIKNNNRNQFFSYITDFPVGFNKKNHLEKIFISIFSSTCNDSVLVQNAQAPKLKIPFTLKNEIQFKYPDMRISGFGYFYGGIFLISILFLIFLFVNPKDKKVQIAILSILFLSAFSYPFAWWARYVPQMWAIPLFIFLFSSEKEKNTKIIYPILFIILINSLTINIQNVKMQNKFNKRYVELMKNSPYPLNETVPIKLIEKKIIKQP